MEKKFQIFVSSTFEDLREEREAVAKAILEIGDIPVGMEMFSAADETQWKLIKRQIEQSDYYVVLVAHRYGSTVEDISFTEREYDYAIEQGVPVLGFLLDGKSEWPPDRIDNDPPTRARLEAFKTKIKSKMVSFWTSADSLTSKVLAALSKQKNLNPMPGWVRAINIPGPETVAEVARLAQEVARLSEDNSTLRRKAGEDTGFALIDAMADDVECQCLIFMYETGRDLPRSIRYVFSTSSGGGGSGFLGGGFGKDRLQNAGMTRLAGGGQFLTMTEAGAKFADWLLKKGRKCAFFWTPVGGWGEVQPGSHEEKWIKEAQADGKPAAVPLAPIAKKPKNQRPKRAKDV
jgi:hypothetical protein